jgi:putative hydroxymethylpyrimidine transport system permease protein
VTGLSRPVRLARALVALVLGPLVIWQAIVWSGVEFYMLPPPFGVAIALAENHELILEHAGATFLEAVLGLALGAALGAESALIMCHWRAARRWLLPLLLIGLAVPVFAIAPLLVLWLGFGIAPKIVVVALIVYFPVTAAFFDGLRRTDPGWLDLAQVMNGSRWAVLRHVRVPAALPALASGLRIATALAPNAAIIGEWVGASSGLGYLMLHDNARTETARMFASLLVLAVFAVALYFTVDFMLRRLIAWQAETLPSEE